MVVSDQSDCGTKKYLHTLNSSLAIIVKYHIHLVEVLFCDQKD